MNNNKFSSKDLTIILSAMAAIAITVYLATFFEVANEKWYLLLFAGATSVASVAIPVLGQKFKAPWAVIPTGLVILAIQVWPEVLLEDRRNIGTLLFGLAIVTEVLVHGTKEFHFGDFLFDTAITYIAGWLIVYFNQPIHTLGLTFLAFIITLMVNFQPKFTIRKNNAKKEEH